MGVADYTPLIATAIIQLLTTAVMIWAVIKAPEWAVNAQWKLQLKAEERQRRLQVFKALMATRANPVHEKHVEALNLIDIEFYTDSAEDNAIRLAWKTYLDHLIQNTKDSESGKNDQSQIDAREQRRQNLLAQLLSRWEGLSDTSLRDSISYI